MSIARTNWRIATLSSAICLTLILIIAALSATPSNDSILKRPSTFFTDPSGARAVYLVLERILPSVQQWRLPLTELATRTGSSRSTLIVMEPGNLLGFAEADALDAWVSSGGQLILANTGGWRMQRHTGETISRDYLTRHDLFRNRGLTGAEGITHSQMKTVGKGRIVYLPDSQVFSNETLGKTDNAVWLAERVS